jgi:hypothetical protein
MGLLMEPVKHNLALTDVQVSLLCGLAFVLFHILSAYPLGYLCGVVAPIAYRDQHSSLADGDRLVRPCVIVPAPVLRATT